MFRRPGREQASGDGPLTLIVGLGNPGARYERTRHNVGFMCLNRLAYRHDLRFHGSKQRAEIARGTISGQGVLLAQPQTFMNDSGLAVGMLARYYHVPSEDIVVIYDDIDLPFGTVRIRARGSSGGHRGIQSIISHLGTSDFPRIKVGIGRGPGEATDYVLSPFSAAQQSELTTLCDQVTDVIEFMLEHGVTAAMNRFNGAATPATR